MTGTSNIKYDALATVFKAIAHPSRLRIIEELSKNRRCVGELTTMIGADTSTISKHLTILRSAGIVDSVKNRNQMLYYLKVPCILNFIGCIESVIENRVKEQMTILHTLTSTESADSSIADQTLEKIYP
ncbi:MAG: winged helix-turn-helix transcriptional regulator [Chitinivibrionales bacterium]|nr:winged helix-turn-helix transcriptional regulator [Chitinivibrionales bacterium]